MTGAAPSEGERAPQSPAIKGRDIEGARRIPLIYIDPVVPIVDPEHSIPYIYGYVFGLPAGFGISKEATAVRPDDISAQRRIPDSVYI